MDEYTMRQAVPVVRQVLGCLDVDDQTLCDDEIVYALRTRGQALPDALGHGDCVSREQYENAEHYAQEGWSWVDDALKALGAKDVFGIWAEGTRAERAEAALREAVKAFDEIDRCAWLLQQAIGNGDSDYIESAVQQYERSHDEMCLGPDAPMSRARAALSADADADTEPTPWETPEDAGRISVENMAKRGFHRDAELRDRAEQVAAGGADFCTAWNDEFGLCDRPPDHPGAHERVTGLGATVTWRDPEPSRAEGDGHCHACDGDGDAEDPCYECGRGTEGGRPREADPQGTSLRTGDASVDGAGDDGRSRAIEAACRVLAREWDGVLVGPVERAIDAALANGGVVTREHYDRAREREANAWKQADAYGEEMGRANVRANEAEDRVRELRRECRMLAQRLLAKDGTLTREERERLISLKLWMPGDNRA